MIQSSGPSPTMAKQSLLDLVSKCSDTQTKTVLQEIADTEKDEIHIMGNKALDGNLQKFAELLSPRIAAQNKIVGQIVQARFCE